jgi:hypothetical protein
MFFLHGIPRGQPPDFNGMKRFRQYVRTIFPRKRNGGIDGKIDRIHSHSSRAGGESPSRHEAATKGTMVMKRQRGST